MTLNFEGGADDIPTFSLPICARAPSRTTRITFGAGSPSRSSRQRSRYRGPQQTSKRFATGIEGARAALRSREHAGHGRLQDQHDRWRLYPCYRSQQSDLAQRGGRTRPVVRFLISALSAALAAVAAWRFRPLSAALAWMAVIVASIAGATIAFNHALALPIAEPFLASLFALAATIGFRFVVADKDRRLLQKSFALYLAPHVINRMLSSNKLPELGGETRDVTVFFSDIEGFSLIAEKMSPDSLMELMNEYLRR